MHLTNQEVKIISQIRMLKTGKISIVKRDNVVFGIYSQTNNGNNVDKDEKGK